MNLIWSKEDWKRELAPKVQNEPDNDRIPKDYMDGDLMEKADNQ